MADKKRTWANRQIIWGWAFLISMTVLLLYLLFAIWLPRLGDGEAPAADGQATTPVIVIPAHIGMPPVKVTAITQAQATLDAAAEQPIQAASAVREAAQTVLAVTAESFETPAVEVTPEAPAVELTAAAPADVAGSSGLGWVEWVLNVIPAFTAMLTFVGLVFTSIMKWRDDLQDMERDDVGYERERLQFEIQKQRFEMEQDHQERLLEQRQMELQLERERLELERLRLEAHLDIKSGSGSTPASSDETQVDA